MARCAARATSHSSSTADGGRRPPVRMTDTVDPPAKPIGREAVSTALIDATISLIIEQGTAVSVREIAARAGVNHGLVHTYFGSKDALVVAAVDEVNRRAGAETDAKGYPAPGLANRRGGELAKVIARMRLDENRDLFTSHPISNRWIEAILTDRPDVDEEEAKMMVASASVVALGWPVFADHICEILDLDVDQRAAISARIDALTAELGGLPAS